MATEERQWTEAERWYRERYSATPERRKSFTTLSAEPVKPLYGPEDVVEPPRPPAPPVLGQLVLDV